MYHVSHLREVEALADELRGDFVLLEAFNRLSCRFQIEAVDTPKVAAPFSKMIFTWLSTFSRRMHGVLGDTTE